MMKRIAQAWAFASILLLPNYIDITSGTGNARMQVTVPLTRIALAHLTDMAIVALFFGLAMALLRSFTAWPRIRLVLVAGLPPLLFARNLNVIPLAISEGMALGITLAWIAFVAFLALRAPRKYAQLAKAGSAVLVGFVCFAAVMTFQLILGAFWRPGIQAWSTPIAAAPASRPRLVWILFDELAYKPTFGDRDPSLSLPNFDRLRAESTLYTDVTPIADRTSHAVPSLLSGHIVTDVYYTSDNEYLIRTRHDPHWSRFDANASLFGEAKRAGLTTSIVGWYIAYCPIFVNVVTQCYWNNDDAQDRGPTSLDASYAENVWVPLRVLMEKIFPPLAWDDESLWDARGHIQSVKDISGHALHTLATSNADIIYLHIPSPHPVGFWNRHTQSFAAGGSYLDGLNYSDRLLGQMLAVLKSQPRWAATTLLVQGDHSWRTWLWRPMPGWSAEDERASDGGQWDPRPLLMIHTPGERTPGTVTATTSLMHAHDFVAAQIRNDSNSASLAAANQH